MQSCQLSPVRQLDFCPKYATIPTRQKSEPKDKIVKRILLSILLLAVMALTACGPLPTPDEMPVIPTDTPKPTSTPVPPPTLETGGAEPVPESVERGGVEVAMTLVNIPDRETIARVNGENITTALYRDELERALLSVTNQYGVDWNDAATHSSLPAFQEQVLDDIIWRVLLRQLAEQEGVTVSQEEVEAEITEIQEQIQEDPNTPEWDVFLVENGLTEEDIYRLVSDDMLMTGLAELHGSPSTAEQVHAAHILVETEEIGQEVLDKLADGEDFAALAAEYSIDPSNKDQGGDLGWFPRGRMVPEFEEAAFSTEPGETSGLVQTSFGFHIIHVFEKEERELDPTLVMQTQQQEFQAWFAEQEAQAEIEKLVTFETPE